MTQRTEAEIVAEIERLRDLFEDHTNENRMMFMHRLSALGWVLSGSPSPVAADAEIAELRASLAKAEEALEPFVKWARPELKFAKELDEHVIRYDDDMEIDMSDFAGDPAQPLLWGDLRRAEHALSDLRKTRGEAQ